MNNFIKTNWVSYGLEFIKVYNLYAEENEMWTITSLKRIRLFEECGRDMREVSRYVLQVLRRWTLGH